MTNHVLIGTSRTTQRSSRMYHQLYSIRRYTQEQVISGLQITLLSKTAMPAAQCKDNMITNKFSNAKHDITRYITTALLNRALDTCLL